MTTPPDPLSPDGWAPPGPPQPPPAPSLWGRITTWVRSRFRRRRSSGSGFVPPPAETSYVPPSSVMPDFVPREEFTLTTPAQGDAFEFEVTVLVRWELRLAAPGEPLRPADPYELAHFVGSIRPGVREVIEDRVRPVARRYPPYRAAEAEQELSRVLQGCFRDGDLQAAVRVRVDVCDPVREELRKVWVRRLVEYGEGEICKDGVRLIGELQELWHEVLRRGLAEFGEVDASRSSWIAPYALSLAQKPEDAATSLRRMLEDRVRHAEDLLNSLSGIVNDSDHVDALEIAFQSDNALRAVLRELGVPAGDPRIDASNGVGGDA